MIELTGKFTALDNSRLHLGVCGSVAAYKALDYMRQAQSLGMNVSATLTEAAARFVTPLSFSSLGADPVYGTVFGDDDPFSHLEPGSVADVLIIAPATATTIARIAAGTASDMLSAQVLSFTGPVLVAPAMNPRMWANQATQQNIALLQRRGITVITPASGMVACGDEGEGKLPEIPTLIRHTARLICKARGLDDLAGKKVLVTLGPTREQWDAVRYWTNLSTGYMGACFAYAAWLRGADVHAVAGPGAPTLPVGIHVHSCVSANDMYEAASSVWDSMDMGIFTAAVADFSPVPHTGGKFKKDGNDTGFALQLVPTIDILATLGGRKVHQKILGFAAESSDLEANALKKLKTKNADMIAGNNIMQPGSGFGSRTNAVFVCSRDGQQHYYPTMSKEDLAWKLLDQLCAI